MAILWQRGLLRLAGVAWLGLTLAFTAVNGWDALSPANLRVFFLLSLGLWGPYIALAWVLSGFGVASGNSLRVAAPIVVFLAVGAAVSHVVAERDEEERRREALAAREAYIAASEAEERAQRAAEERARRDREEREKRKERKREELAQTDLRAKQILASFPINALDLRLDREDAPLNPRPMGSNDHRRREAEGPVEYLVECARTFVRWKCARSVALAELDRAVTFQATLDEYNAAILARRAANERADRIAREAEEERFRKLVRLERLYAGAGPIQRWCALNHNKTFGPANAVQRSMKQECDVVREKNLAR